MWFVMPYYHKIFIFAVLQRQLIYDCESVHFCLLTALHGMQTWSSDENTVCLSVCLSVKRVLCDKMEERSVQIFIPDERPFSLVFWEKEWLVGATPSTWNFEPTGSRWSEIADFEPIFSRNASTVTSSEKGPINTDRKFTMRFPMRLRWSSYVAPMLPKLAQKRNMAFFRPKSHFAWRKSATKFLCENCQRQCCKAFIGLTIRAKMIGGGDPFNLKFWVKVTALGRSRRFSIYFRS